MTLAALALCGCKVEAQALPQAYDGTIRIDSVAVPLDPRHPEALRLGAFAYAGGIQLQSPDSDQLGGLSDLQVSTDGQLLAVSDDGQIMQARLVLDDQGHLGGLTEARIEPLLGVDGRAVQGKQEGDAEGVAVWPNGDRMVSFERDHRILLYPASGGAPRPLPIPPEAMPENAGIEGLAIAASRGPGAYWVGLEKGSIWLCHLESSCGQEQGQVRPAIGYRLTALAETPDGDLIVLHHGWDPLRGSRALLWITRPRGNGQADVLAKLALAPPLTVDNFEGVSVQKMPDGVLRLLLITDDNFSPTQRTLLLAFDWRLPALTRGGANPPMVRPPPTQR